MGPPGLVLVLHMRCQCVETGAISEAQEAEPCSALGHGDKTDWRGSAQLVGTVGRELHISESPALTS